jgi:hypothetical protein
MKIEFVHQMPSVEDAYQAVLNVDDEAPQLVCGSGIISYSFAATDQPIGISMSI